MLIAFVPAAAIVVVLAALALMVSSVLFRDGRSTRRALWLALASTGVAAVICLPWVVGVCPPDGAPSRCSGCPSRRRRRASWSSLLRFAAGPIGGSPLSWGFALAGLAPLILARGDRFRWAVRFWSLALVFWLAAWIIGRGWTGSLAIDPLILLAPAAAAVAAAIGLGVAAFEEDLRAAEFGWRQLVTVVATVVVILGAVPTAISALPGRWDLPLNDFSQSVAWMHAQGGRRGVPGPVAGGHQRHLPGIVGRRGRSGLCHLGERRPRRPLALERGRSRSGRPDWPRPSTLARAGETDQLGRLLAPAGVRYVALLTSLAPEISGEQNPTEYPVPADLAPALTRQLDLSPVLSGTGHHRLCQQRLAAPAGRGPGRDLRARLGAARSPGREPGIRCGGRRGAGVGRTGGVAVVHRPPDPGDRPRRGGPIRAVELDRPDRAGPSGLRVRMGGALPGERGRAGHPPLRWRTGGPAVLRGLDRHVAGGRGPPDRAQRGPAVCPGAPSPAPEGRRDP